MDLDPGSLIKKYPLQTIGVVIGVVGVAYIYIRQRNNSGGAVAVTSGADPVAAQYDLSIRQMQMQLSRDAQIGKMQYDFSIANIEAQLAATRINADTELALARDRNAAELAATNTAANVSLAQINQNAAIQQRQIEADLAANRNATDVQMSMISSNLAATLSNNATTQNIAGILANQQIALANINANVQITGIQEMGATNRAWIKMMRADSTNRMVGQIAGSVVGLAGGFI